MVVLIRKESGTQQFLEQEKNDDKLDVLLADKRLRSAGLNDSAIEKKVLTLG